MQSNRWSFLTFWRHICRKTMTAMFFLPLSLSLSLPRKRILSIQLRLRAQAESGEECQVFFALPFSRGAEIRDGELERTRSCKGNRKCQKKTSFEWLIAKLKCPYLPLSKGLRLSPSLFPTGRTDWSNRRFNLKTFLCLPHLDLTLNWTHASFAFVNCNSR